MLYTALVRTTAQGRFSFRLRAGQEHDGDDERGIRSGGQPTFQQRVGRPGHRRTVSRTPRYRVIGLWAISHGCPSGSVKAAE